jgi:ABC-2 type transport system permease protein
MNKIWLVIKREYLTRVRNRSFIISTFVTPLFFVALIAAIGYFTAKQVENTPKQPVPDAITNAGSAAAKPHSGVAYAVGYISSFAIYLTILIYGTMVMRGVSEEKTNRIAEIIISSVKPFQLMLGKIIGVGAVGMTQFILWILLILVFSSATFLFLPHEVVQNAGSAQSQAQAAGIFSSLASVNLPLIIFCFIFYFIFGYLFYASLFAAVGSAVNEDAQDTQSLMLPVTMPVVLSIAMMTQAINQPSGSLATWSSMVPFFSPVVMMARLPFGVPDAVPVWQLILSMALLLGGFLFTAWVSAKIYRTGILLYGKKTTWKEMWKWALRS